MKLLEVLQRNRQQHQEVAGKTRIGLLGIAGWISATYIGQRAILIYHNHPYIELAGFIADDPADAGKTLGEVQQDR